jgi:hypothetical protein
VIHTRAGYAPRKSDDEVAKLNDDMIPAIVRRMAGTDSTLKESPEALDAKLLDARAEAAMAKLAKEHPPAQILVNPVPSDPPKILEPGK